MLQRIARSAFRIERRAVEPLFVIRCSLGVSISLIAGFTTGQPLYAIAAAVGALSTGFGSLQGIYGTRAATMLAMALAMAFSTAFGTLTAHSLALTLTALAAWGIAYGIFASLGAAAAAVCLNACIALIVFQHLPASGATAVITALCVVAGGLVQTLLLVVLWPVQRYPLERAALAGAYRALQSFAHTLDCAHPELPPIAPLQNVRDTLADPHPFGRNAASAAFATLMAEAERIRATLGQIVAADCTRYDLVRPGVVATLGAIASALEAAAIPADRDAEQTMERSSDDPAVRRLLGQLRAAWRSASVPLRGAGIPSARALRSLFPDFDEARATLRASLSLRSPFGRHAIRTAVVLVLCGLVTHVVHWDRGYWVALTAVIVLRPDFTTTLSRGLARIAGTIVGIVISTALILIVPDTPHVSVAFAIVFATIGYAAFQLNYALYSLTVTAYVVFLLALAGQPEQAAVVNRLAATLCGGALAMLSYAFWPTWESAHTLRRLIEMIEAGRLYTRALLAGLIDPAQRNMRSLNALRNEVWSARARAQESLERMLSEPASTHELDADLAVQVVAASQRIGLANLAFASQYSDDATPPFPEAEPFARAVETAISGIVAALERKAPPFGMQLLRDEYARMADAIPGDRPGRTSFLANADLLVDGINTASDILKLRV